LQGEGAGQLRLGGLDVRQLAIRRQARVDILSKFLAQRRPRIGWEQVQPPPGCADVVCFIDHQLATGVKPPRCAGKREREKQTHQAKDSRIDRAGMGNPGVSSLVARSQPAPRLEHDQHAQKQPDETKDGCEHKAHFVFVAGDAQSAKRSPETGDLSQEDGCGERI
jgi:hypothetical protein